MRVASGSVHLALAKGVSVGILLQGGKRGARAILVAGSESKKRRKKRGSMYSENTPRETDATKSSIMEPYIFPFTCHARETTGTNSPRTAKGIARGEWTRIETSGYLC